MSMIRCDDCGDIIDSDDDPECFVTGPLWRVDAVCCPSCRDSWDELGHERQERQGT